MDALFDGRRFRALTVVENDSLGMFGNRGLQLCVLLTLNGL